MKLSILIFFFLIGLSSFSQVKNKPFSSKSLDTLNSLIKGRFAGDIHSFIYNEYLSLYAETSQYLTYSNLKTHQTSGLRLDDSLLFALIFTKEQLTEIEEKMVLHKKDIDAYRPVAPEKHPESQLESFCYDGKHIYLKYALMQFYGMKTLQSPAKTNKEAVYYYEYYLVELPISDGLISKGRIWNMKNEKGATGSRFDIMENQIAMYFKTTVDKHEQYEYIILNKAWDKKLSVQLFPGMLSEWISENIFYNEFVLNTSQNILINNDTRQKMKTHQGTEQLQVRSTACIQGAGNLYVRVYKHTEKTSEIHQVNLTKKENKVLTTFKDQDFYRFIPILYFEKETGILYVLDINDLKQLYIVDFIKT